MVVILPLPEIPLLASLEEEFRPSLKGRVVFKGRD